MTIVCARILNDQAITQILLALLDGGQRNLVRHGSNGRSIGWIAVSRVGTATTEYLSSLTLSSSVRST